MAERYLRRCALSLGSQFSIVSDASQNAAKLSFEAIHSLNETKPSTVRVWGLSEGTAALAVVEVRRQSELSLFAGYRGSSYGQILRGTPTKAYQEREGVERVLTIVVGPVSNQARKTGVLTLQEEKITVRALAQRAADAMGVEIADVESLPDALLPQVAGTYSPTELMNEIADSYSLTWAEDEGRVLASSSRKPFRRSGAPIIVSDSTGLIGSPTVEDNGQARCKMALSPQVFVGSVVRIQSLLLKEPQTFRVKGVIHRGDTWEGEWVTELRLTE